MEEDKSDGVEYWETHETIDEQTGATVQYYSNLKTGEVTWDRPECLDSDSEKEEADEDEDEKDDLLPVEDAGPAASWVEKLQVGPGGETISLADCDLLRQLITNAEFTWKNEFVAAQGFDAIAKLLGHTELDQDLRLLVLACLETYLDESQWLNPILSTPFLLPNLVLCLATQHAPLRARAMELLAIICWLADEGRRSVLEALESRMATTGGKKFHGMTAIVSELSAHSIDDTTGEPRCNDMILINSLVNSSDNLEERIALRARLNDLGLGSMLEDLNARVEDRPELRLLQAQLEIYDGGLLKDSRQTTMDQTDLSNPDQLFAYLKGTAVDDGHLQQLVAILQLLCTIPDKGDNVWTNTHHIVKLATQQCTDITDTDTPRYLTYTELKAALRKREEETEKEANAHLKELEEKLEAQRSELHKLRMVQMYAEEQKEKLAEAVARAKQLEEKLLTQAGGGGGGGGGGLSAEHCTQAQALLQLPELPESARKLLSELLAKDGHGANASSSSTDASGATAAATPAGAPPPPPPPPPPGPPGAPPAPGLSGAAVGPKLPPKMKLKPSRPMKKFHWATLPTKEVHNTLWKEVDDRPLLEKLLGDFKEDLELFELMFGAKEISRKVKGVFNAGKEGEDQDGEGGGAAGGAGPAAGAAGKKKQKQELVKLVDEKRSYACDITLARFRLPNNHLRDMILGMDLESKDGLDSEKLSQLLKIVPTHEEIETVRAYTGDKELLGTTERFTLTMSEIPRLKERLELTLFKQGWRTSADRIAESISLVESTLGALRDAKQLMALFAIILAFGNYMNGGNAKGGAYGFRLSTLTMLKTNKSSDNSTDMLTFLVRWLQKHRAEYPDVPKFVNEVEPCKHASRIEQQDLNAQVSRMTSKLDLLQQELKVEPQDTVADRFHAVMSAFFREAKREADDFVARLEKCAKDYEELLVFYGETAKGSDVMEWHEFFDHFDQFSVSFQLAERRVAEDDVRIAREEKRLKWLEEQKKKKDQLQEAAERARQAKKAKKAKKKKSKESAGLEAVRSVLSGANDADSILLQMKSIRRRKKQEEGGSVEDSPDKPKKKKSQRDNEKRQAIREAFGLTADTGDKEKRKKEKNKKEKKKKRETAGPIAPEDMPACPECNCSKFAVHPFKQNYCNWCFHFHV